MRAEGETDKITIECLECEIIGLGGGKNNNDELCINSDLVVMRQVLDDIKNQNKALRGHVAFLTPGGKRKNR
jgi:hypothetical protein